jgi:glycosyltransferase involved in cell wall biosynthesis
MSASSSADVAVVVPAKNERDRIAATVAAAKTISDVVIVVDDGSTDDTVRTAQRQPPWSSSTQNRGKGAAMTTGAGVVAGLDARDGLSTPRHLLFLDADLEETAKEGAAGRAVRAGAADMTIGVLPPQKRQGGGFGFVVRLSRNGVRRLTTSRRQPLSGSAALAAPRYGGPASRPRLGVETAMLVDLLRLGMRVKRSRWTCTTG